MARKMTEWPSKRGPITKIMPSDGCIGDTVPLAVGKWYEFHEFGWHMGNVGLTPSGAETLVFWVSQPLAWLVAPKDVPLMTRRGDLKLSHGATAKARENAVKQDRVPTTNAIKSL